MTDVAVENYEKHHLEALICLGGGGTQKHAFRLAEKGLNIITLPKTIDNDVEETDVAFGFDTACGIATEAMDRLHTTAHSHHRVIVVETMGHRVGWLALCAGVSSGADVILIPEIPYGVETIAESVLQRSRSGKNFSIIAIAEGALSREQATILEKLGKPKNSNNGNAAGEKLKEATEEMKDRSMQLAGRLEELTGLESRVTILGHVQRGGTPSSKDRLLSTVLGTTAVQLVEQGRFGVMVAYKSEKAVPVPLEEVTGRRKYVPVDHPFVESARQLGTCFGDI
jgi:6-phosphofructokinase 1